jgi:HD-GYP domain-containing protein (c-di-GMP phosphodiesterase class II)
MRLFKTLLLFMLIAGVVPIAMLGALSRSHTRELLMRSAQELAQERVKQVALKAQNTLNEPANAALSLRRIPAFFQLPLPEKQAHLAFALNQRREISVVTLFDLGGNRLPGLQAVAVKDTLPSELALHQAAASALLPGLSGVRFSKVYVSPSRQKPMLTVAFPLGSPPKGFAAAELSLASLAELLSHERVGSRGFSYIADRRGYLVAGPKALGAYKAGDDLSQRPAVAHFLATSSVSPEQDIFRVGNFGEGKDKVVAAYTTLPEVGWAIFSEQPMELAYRDVGVMEERTWALALAATAVAAALAWLFARSVTRPLRGFIEGALKIARGTFGVEVAVKSKNELGELAQTFNYMSKQLGAYDEETKRLYQSLESGYLETIVALANSIDSKDAYTRGHSQRVGDVAVEIGREMGLTEIQLRQLQYGGILHDIGKIGIVESILCKKSRLTDEEMVVMREHPAIGHSIVEPVSFLAPVRDAVRYHHENWDGTGYPDKLAGKDIPLIARIVACADTFDACTSTRPYQKAMPLEKAMEVLEGVKGARLDPDTVDALRRVLEKKGVRLEGQKLAKLAPSVQTQATGS